ncbi:BglG family transcription antiterminator [Neobacillus dielmonensis]|uniref:BglG family transcription antiterminator n=1 Tax=Neobacillus dielmonensis TaxID=1347369 RepID=UPI0005A97665|nr:BglG family transcription antiterminator [Neobacillus dielmonensis]
MLEKRYIDLFQQLKEDEYQTALCLAQKINVSDKTARTLLKDLSRIFKEHGAFIEIKHGQGYRLQITNPKQFTVYINEEINQGIDELPNSVEERVLYIKEYLLKNSEYIKLDDLSEELYISRKTITNDLKKIEDDIKKYNLQLIRKPNYGVKIQGDEFDLRLCLASCMGMKYGTKGLTVDSQEKMDEIAISINSILQQNEFQISNVALQNLLIHIFIAIERIRENHQIVIDDDQLSPFSLENEILLASELAKAIEQKISITFPKSEIKYLAIHLAGKRIYRSSKQGKNFVISQNIDNLVTEMLEKIYESFKIDFRDNLDLRMSLSQHMVPLEVRLRFDMTMKNPLLMEIKERFLLAYSIATFACGILGKHYGKILDENEIGYFAMSFELALERDKYNIRKKNILVVCSSGVGSAQFLKYKYLEKFGNYINQIETCDVHRVSKKNLDSIDYIITTVPISEKVKVPILEVQYFLENKDVKNVIQVLTKDSGGSISQYYSEDLFFTGLNLSTKEDVLEYLCQRIQEVEDVPEDFQAAVLEREKIAPTSFGNLVAIPHPSRTLSKRTFASVAILKQPINWDNQEVQVVFLISIENHPSKEIQKFYKTTSKLLINKNLISELLRKSNFETLISLLNLVESEMED